jgi:cytochrome-b5 reductase
MLQIIDAILSNPNDYTQLSLLYANLSPENILLKDNLDALAHAHPNFKVFRDFIVLSC